MIVEGQRAHSYVCVQTVFRPGRWCGCGFFGVRYCVPSCTFMEKDGSYYYCYLPHLALPLLCRYSAAIQSPLRMMLLARRYGTRLIFFLCMRVTLVGRGPDRH